MDKRKLKEHCIQLLQSQLQELQESLRKFQEAANAETKSTAGDKHDTARSMMQLEVDKVYQQVRNAETELGKMTNVPVKPSKEAEPGAVVVTNANTLYLSVGLGPIEYENKTIVCLSGKAPLTKAVNGLKKGESYNLNGKKFLIVDVV